MISEIELDEIVDSVKDVFRDYVSKNKVEVYFPEEDEWQRVVYRPIILASVDRWVEAKAREMYGIRFTLLQKKIAYKRVFPYSDSELSGGEFFIAEGAFINSSYFNSIKRAERYIVHEFTHANLTGKWGMANEAARAMVRFYKTGEFEVGKRAYDISCKYHELDEIFARFAELMYFDIIDEFERVEEFKYYIKCGGFWFSAVQMFHLYKAGIDIVSRVKSIMENGHTDIIFPQEYEFIDFESMRKGVF